jgi:hypothetical protein
VMSDEKPFYQPPVFVPSLSRAHGGVKEAKAIPILKGLILIADETENPRLIVDEPICPHLSSDAGV